MPTRQETLAAIVAARAEIDSAVPSGQPAEVSAQDIREAFGVVLELLEVTVEAVGHWENNP